MTSRPSRANRGRGESRTGRPATPMPPEGTAERLHSACLHLLRRLRRVDDRSGLSPAALSALSVVVHAGPCSNKELADAEGVRAPTMTRVVGELERTGLVRRQVDERDRRSVRIRATAAGRRRLERGRDRRVARLEAAIEALGASERKGLARAVRLLERLVEEDRRDGGSRSATGAEARAERKRRSS